MSEVLIKNSQKVFTTVSDFKSQGQVRKNEMWEIRISREETEEIMKELDEIILIGPGGVPGYILKECRQEMVELIQDIIACSIKTGKVLKEWKRVDIMPICKTGNKEEPLHYRPVSLTSIVCRICENVIKKQWTKYLEKEGIITDRQFGFSAGSSCVTNLISFYFRVIDITQEMDGYWIDTDLDIQ